MNNMIQCHDIKQSQKQIKKQFKIIDKLTQITSQYQENNLRTIIDQRINEPNQNKQVQISNNQLRKQQINKLLERLNNFTDDIQEIHPNDLCEFIKDFDLLFTNFTQKVIINEREIEIIDIRLKVHDEFEDYIYSLNHIIHNTFRRGLCLLVDNNKIRVIKKGLKKFFDLNLNYLDTKNLIKQNEKNIQKYIFGQFNLEQSMLIQQMEKVNGENAQISFDKELNSWIIGSKNVTIISQNEEDLIQFENIQQQQQQQQQQQLRYNFALKIARYWFNQLKNMNEDIIEQIKLFLNQYTLVGEYCGDKDSQHLIYYDKIQLKFYASVPKEFTQKSINCIHPILTQQFLNNVQLNSVKIIQFYSNNEEEFKQILYKLYKEISISKIEELGEGNVIYFSSIFDENNKDNNYCYTLTKIKTIDYRLKRKIREKLKQLLNKEQNFEEMLQQYKIQANELICQVSQQFINDKMNFDLQINLAEKAFQFICDEKIQTNLNIKKICLKYIREKFIDILKLLQDEKITNNPFLSLNE